EDGIRDRNVTGVQTCALPISMRWVLGEQSMRQLRGKKGDDIIFAGGDGRSALGMAEVSLTLDNSTGWVPSEYSEIHVTRRSYRRSEERRVGKECREWRVEYRL